MDRSMTDFAAAPRLDDREEHFRIPGPRDGLSLFLRFLPAEKTWFRRRRLVLYVHGATFPSALSIAHRFDGKSWRDALDEAGFDVWGWISTASVIPTAIRKWISPRPPIPRCVLRRMRPGNWRPPFYSSSRTRTSKSCR
jgi:hypothetical protein